MNPAARTNDAGNRRGCDQRGGPGAPGAGARARRARPVHHRPESACRLRLVRAGAILGEGWHARAGEAHAEVAALRAAGAGAAGATAYVTLEPCSHTGRTPPCADALIAAGIRRVVCCSADPNPKVAGDGIKRLEAAGITVSVGALAGDARALNPGYFSRFERARPLIRLKLAMSLDARTAPAQGGRIWISGEESRADVQKWRARSSAILTGAGTVRADDPRLNVRLNYGPWVRQPLRVVLASRPIMRAEREKYSRAAAPWFSSPPRDRRRLPQSVPLTSSSCRRRAMDWISRPSSNG